MFFITVIEEYEVSKKDRSEVVISDQLVYLGDGKRDLSPIRLVRTGAFNDKEILLVMSEPPEKMNAALISVIYRQR